MRAHLPTLAALAAVLAAATAGTAVVANACGLLPNEQSPCEGIRPGAANTGLGVCSYAWALTDGEEVYVTTAGHCTGGGNSPGIGRWGSTVLRVCGPTASPLDSCEPGYDYALVKVLPEKRHLVTNVLCGWGIEPTAVYESTLPVALPVFHHGYGSKVGAFDETRGRAGVSTALDDARTFSFVGVAVPGDSGSAALVLDHETRPRALGVITHLLPVTADETDPAHQVVVVGTRLDVIIREAGEALGVSLRLY